MSATLETEYHELRGKLEDRAAIETLDAVFHDWADRNPYRFAQHLALFREMLTPEYRERRQRIEAEFAKPRNPRQEPNEPLDDALMALQSMPQMAEQL